jgi:hypothetical protein
LVALHPKSRSRPCSLPSPPPNQRGRRLIRLPSSRIDTPSACSPSSPLRTAGPHLLAAEAAPSPGSRSQHLRPERRRPSCCSRLRFGDAWTAGRGRENKHRGRCRTGSKNGGGTGMGVRQLGQVVRVALRWRGGTGGSKC